MGTRQEQGFSYVIVMFLVAILSFIAVRAQENILTSERRFKEAELLMVGQAYRDAIRDYCVNSPGSDKKYPMELKDLLEDKRDSALRRSLRRLYRDPMTGSKDWGLVKTENGELIGVHSLSLLRPIKRDGFPAELAGFSNAATYQNWRFVYQAQ